ncbi:hypothetical protein [Endozoicomonas lisbonensis]|uniref:Uncharacterized protein n=1 Tax=Endozoicomonas lisbonensis TaxID=3120522 RepID=A0ABV2SDZ4_9GAMM
MAPFNHQCQTDFMNDIDDNSLWFRLRVWSSLWCIRLPILTFIGLAYWLYAETTLWQDPAIAFGMCLFSAVLVMSLCLSAGIALDDHD